MTYELIITEKPNAAKMIAAALADGKPIKEEIQGAPYYKVTHGKHDIVVGCAVGHLHTVTEKNKSFTYPKFDLVWKEAAEVDPKSYTKKYVAALKKLAKGASSFTVATDYDVEGEVIGYNCVRFLCKQKDAARMKFSTLTKEDLVEAYDHKSPTLDWGQALAGETRHFMDWMYGINLSRALTLAMKNAGIFKILSSGRVQGPALKLVIDKEREIQAFKPVKYWEIQLNGQIKNAELEFWHEKDRFSDEKTVIAIVEKVKGKNGTISQVQTSQFIQKAPTPFDLTTLQMEAYRLFGIKPKFTLDIAQELYTSGLISYPRTSSQKLPNVNYKKILEALGKNKIYSDLTKELMKGELKPTEGKKTDPAHPAIYPTGLQHKLEERKFKVYDLIVKRFMACFADDAKRETITLKADFAKEIFVARGTTTINPGWHKFYAPYVKLAEQQMPICKEKDPVTNKEVIKHDKETKPPSRFTPASIIKELESQNLGTKATRASIVESLYSRDYVKNDSIEATELGIQTVDTLEKYCPEILDAELTRHFELEMERVSEKKGNQEKVLDEVKVTLTKLLEKFKKNEKNIGKALTESHIESMKTQSEIGRCPKCGSGMLTIIYSKKAKRKFIGCSNYPDCQTIFNLPVFGKPQRTEKICEQCKHPIIKILNGRRTREVCINTDCPSKKVDDPALQQEIDDMVSGKIQKQCPKCSKPLLVRKSMYGQFLGCTGFPKCRHIERIQVKKVFEKKPSKKRVSKTKTVKSEKVNTTTDTTMDVTKTTTDVTKGVKKTRRVKKTKEK